MAFGGLFGSSKQAQNALGAYNPSSLSGGDKLAFLGAMLSDLGAGKGPQNTFAMRQMLGQQQLLARKMAAEQAVQGLFAPQDDPNAPPAQEAMSIPSTGTGLPALNLPRIDAAPQARMPSIGDANTVRQLLAAKAAGADIGPAVDILKATQADIGIGPGGEAYNKKDPGVLGRTFASPTVVNGVLVNQNDPSKFGERVGGVNLQSINGFMVDPNDRGNVNRYLPEAPVKGANPYPTEQGGIGWAVAPGTVEAIRATTAAEAGAKGQAEAQYDLVDVPMPDGSSQKMSRSSLLSALGMGGGSPAGADPAGGLGRSQTPGDKVYSEKQAETVAAQYKGIQDAGMKAPNAIARYKQIGDLLAGVDGNKFSPMGVELAKMANSLGWKVDSKLPNKEASAAIINQMALELRDPSQGAGMPGAMSDADRKFLMNSVPSLTQSAAGRQQMVKMGVALNERNQAVAQMARKWQERYGRLDRVNPATGKSFFDNLQEWSGRNSLFGQQ